MTNRHRVDLRVPRREVIGTTRPASELFVANLIDAAVGVVQARIIAAADLTHGS
ncbi:MAG: hypothetical protein ABI658_31160 [Acidimicrobiales bacterium]